MCQILASLIELKLVCTGRKGNFKLNYRSDFDS